MPNPLTGGLIVPIDLTTSSIKKITAVNPKTFIVNAIDNGTQGVRVTISFDIPNAIVIGKGKDEDSLLKTEAHWGFDGAGPSVLAKHDTSIHSILLKKGTSREVNFKLDFTISNGKIGGAGVAASPTKRAKKR